jgi:hypothetical protein
VGDVNTSLSSIGKYTDLKNQQGHSRTKQYFGQNGLYRGHLEYFILQQQITPSSQKSMERFPK